ncbi:hypothetical protein ETK16_16240 [Salmonella enterica]|nr:hypothetical protein [Salmonella enterica]EBH8949515.1 hypothetical protein [Salmonella enterica subsp. diarizonae serovar 48:i:z]ECE5795042.1 hypothetical protein [Salmonella enterica subsp. diarizonae]EBJ3538950.1 hypothetical protein [Salmonella enterica]EBJ5715369.1 hypothetical protein [Salmonella enterica]
MLSRSDKQGAIPVAPCFHLPDGAGRLSGLLAITDAWYAIFNHSSGQPDATGESFNDGNR